MLCDKSIPKLDTYFMILDFDMYTRQDVTERSGRYPHVMIGDSLYVYDIILLFTSSVYFRDIRHVTSVEYNWTAYCCNDYQLGLTGHSTYMLL